MPKKQKPKPRKKEAANLSPFWGDMLAEVKALHKKAKAAGVVPPVLATAKRKPAPKPCPDCQYDDNLGTYSSCHICSTIVSYTGSNALDAMPRSIRDTYFASHATLPPEKRGHKLGWGGTWYCAYTAHRVYTLFGVRHTFCIECLNKQAAKC